MQSKENQEIVYYWKNEQNLVVAIKKGEPGIPSTYSVIMLDDKNYGGAPISNRRKVVGGGNNKQEVRKAVVAWMKNHPEATRIDHESLGRKLRRV